MQLDGIKSQAGQGAFTTELPPTILMSEYI